MTPLGQPLGTEKGTGLPLEKETETVGQPLEKGKGTDRPLKEEKDQLILGPTIGP